MSQRPEYLFVLNNGSGRDDGSERLQKIKDFAEACAERAVMYELPAKFSFEDIKARVEKINPKKLVAVGGDGTVNLMASIAAGTDICLGIIPGGSANGMAKELGITADIESALKIISGSREKRLDLIRINDNRYCIHLSDIGINARLIKYFDEGKMRGKLGYAAVAMRTIYDHKKMRVSITTPGDNMAREAYMVAIANARTYGTGAVINPDGDLGDGKFELIIVRRLSIFSILKTLLNPARFNPKNFEIVCCTSAKMTMARAMHFQIDGEYIGKVDTVRAEIVPGVLRMLV